MRKEEIEIIEEIQQELMDLKTDFSERINKAKRNLQLPMEATLND